MKKNNLVGYMLGNENHIVVRGDQWCDAGHQVYICTNKEIAKAILEQSQQLNLEPNNIVWTTIYRVYAPNINIEKYTHGGNLAWTNEGNKIFVDTPVFYRAAQKISEQNLTKHARLIQSDFFRLFNKMEKRK